MEKKEIVEKLDEYRDAHSPQKLLDFLVEQISEELDGFSAETEQQRHQLNMVVRELEEELDWVESEKLAGFDPEQE